MTDPAAAVPPGYAAARRRLVERLSAVYASAASAEARAAAAKARADRHRAKRDELRAVAKDLQQLAERLAERIDAGAAWSELEQAFGGQARALGVVGTLRELSEQARHAADDIGDPRALPLLPWAALVFLHLRYRYGLAHPTTYVGHPAVEEFADVLAAASGEERGVDRALTLLKGARRAFDPHMPPEGIGDIDY